MATTFTSTPGYFDWLSKKATMLDEEYASKVDIDDISAMWRTTKWLLSTEAQSKTTATPIFRTWEGTLSERSYQVDGALTTGDLTWTLDNTDGLRVKLVVDGLQIGSIHELKMAGIRSAKQSLPLLHDVGYYTLWQMP